jgi:hypothetical protein
MTNLQRPSQTVFLAEQDPNSTVSSASGPPMSSSTITAYYAIARHSHNKLSNLSMCDGSSISARTNDFWEPQSVADGTISSPPNTGQAEWSTARTIYWYPSPTTPD